MRLAAAWTDLSGEWIGCAVPAEPGSRNQHLHETCAVDYVNSRPLITMSRQGRNNFTLNAVNTLELN